MKNIAFLALCIAIFSCAFVDDFAEDPDCINSYYWFHAKTGTHKTICSSILRTDLSEVLDPNQNGIIDQGELMATFPTVIPKLHHMPVLTLALNMCIKLCPFTNHCDSKPQGTIYFCAY